MNRLISGLLVAAALVGSTAARADWDDRREHGRRGEFREQGRGQGWGLRVERHEREERHEWDERRNSGHYEVRTTSVWVAGMTQQVWVEGRCTQTYYGPQCTQGGWQTYTSPGHYENRQESVWVPGWR
jgi:hypothetical protein